jgi:arylsulfatase A-like enzyme
MKAIMVMFDSLNRHMLPPYGCDWVHAPNFQRLAKKSVTFDTCYVGSMPCMPARRELHTGRYNFLHRGWGPIEPFDDSMPEMLKEERICSHLISDHYHYWEEGGCNYHTRYENWQISRGQEGDPWICDLNDPEIPKPNTEKFKDSRWGRQDWVNRSHMQDEKDMPQPRSFAMGEDFLDMNHKHDNWFLHLETFDPHEPYFSADRFKELYDFDFSKSREDWPNYTNGTETEKYRELLHHYRFLNAALISQCDHYLGKILDKMDEYDLWDDTMLIVNTDHGFLLGEHDWWGKCHMPFYNEIANTPFFIWDPRSKVAGEHRQSLVQTIDIAPTLLDFFGLDLPKDMQGKPLGQTIIDDTPVREAGLFGMFGGHVNVTDGKYVYMRSAGGEKNWPLYEYTHMPTHMRRTFEVEQMQKLEELGGPFEFTKGCRVMKIPSGSWMNPWKFGHLLFDVENDPKQENPIKDAEIEKKMLDHLIREMKANDAPKEQYERLGLDR